VGINGRLSAALDLTAKQGADIRNTRHNDSPEIAIEDLAASQRCKERATRIRASDIDTHQRPRYLIVYVPCESRAERTSKTHREQDKSVRRPKRVGGRCVLLDQYHAEPEITAFQLPF
jgi:hypothetical protein